MASTDKDLIADNKLKEKVLTIKRYGTGSGHLRMQCGEGLYELKVEG